MSKAVKIGGVPVTVRIVELTSLESRLRWPGDPASLRCPET